MPHYDFRTPRVYLDTPLAGGQEVAFDRAQANYLQNVLRLKRGDELLLFNGRDGEWQASLAGTGKRALTRCHRGAHAGTAAARPTCISCSRRSSMPGWIIWCRRRWRWAPRGCSR